MANDPGLYYDAQGELLFVVVPHVAGDFSAHDQVNPSLVRVVLPYDVFASTPPTNIDGLVSFHKLSKIAQPKLAQIDPIRAAALGAKISKAETRLADIATKQAAFDKKMSDFTASLDPQQKAAFDHIEHPFMDPIPANLVLSQNQQLAYADILKGNYATAIVVADTPIDVVITP